MTLFNNNKLPLNEAQKLQQQITRKVAPLKKNHEVDKQLAIAYQEGAHEAGLQLFNNYLDDISYIYRNPSKARHRRCNVDIRNKTSKEDKEDLFQEICYHFFRLIEEFDPEVSNFKALIQGKLHLRVYEYYYQKLMDAKINEVRLQDKLDLEETLKNILLEENKDILPPLHLKLYSCYNNLTELQRKVLDLTVAKGWNCAVAAKEIGHSHESVKKHKQRSIKRLKKLMEVAS